jgi:nucleoside-diphosphate-sugar epimerase
MKIAITGASGFIGKNLYEYLGNDYELIKMNIRYKVNQNFNIQENIIIHLAGKAHDLKNVSNAEEYYEANYELTKQLFDSFLDSNASVFIFMSTVKAVSDKIDGILSEETLPNPNTHYGKSKRKAEEYILSKKLTQGKRVYILRPCMVHGPGNKGNLNLLYKLVCKGYPWPLASFDNKRSFLSIDNLCFVIGELLKTDGIPSGVYQLADDRPVSTNELIKMLSKSLEIKTKIWKVNPTFIKSLALLGDFLHLPLNSERLNKLTENYVVSNEKIIKTIGRSLPVKVDEGLTITFESFKKIK